MGFQWVAAKATVVFTGVHMGPHVFKLTITLLPIYDTGDLRECC